VQGGVQAGVQAGKMFDPTWGLSVTTRLDGVQGQGSCAGCSP
jgi:hypothetical protein